MGKEEEEEEEEEEDGKVAGRFAINVVKFSWQPTYVSQKAQRVEKGARRRTKIVVQIRKQNQTQHHLLPRQNILPGEENCVCCYC